MLLKLNHNSTFKSPSVQSHNLLVTKKLHLDLTPEKETPISNLGTLKTLSLEKTSSLATTV